MKVSGKELILFGMLGGLVTMAQITLSFIPNVEIVSLLIILFSLIYREKALYIVCTFVIIMGISYGFGLWWLGYVILWPTLSIVTCKIRKSINEKYLALSIYSGIFGLLFGFFYAIPNAIFVGLNAGIGYWIAGIPYDIMHGIGNFFTMLFLGKKIFVLLNKLNNIYFK